MDLLPSQTSSHDSSQTRRSFIINWVTAIIILGIIILISFEVGINIGKKQAIAQTTAADVINKTEGESTNVDFAPFWKAWSILDEKYVATKHSTSTVAVATTTDQDRVYGAIKGMVAALNDPYTVFFPPEESQIFESEISGNFEGVGMEVGQKDGVLTVIAALKNTPAERAGIKSGDKILKIDDTVTTDMSIDAAVKMIRGKKGTAVTFTLLRDGTKDPIVIKVVRDTIDIPTIDTDRIGTDIFVIHVYSFSADAPDLFRNALRQFILSGADKLIIDLRGNPGGYLDAAVDMSSWFLPSGKVIVREDYGGKGGQTEDVVRSKGYNIFNDNLKAVILIDGGSASASEIMAGALHEYGIVKLVGTQSFGKGSVQELIPLTSDTNLKVTVARWLTPNGFSISAQGLTPDYVVPIPDGLVVTKDNDPQLQKAVEILRQ
ncbi:MAG: S41 family peptidase [Candidatus Pacebacteria bacterium]|nr:S41 family peptidase [Candidatus Paceibacterota bacterium]